MATLPPSLSRAMFLSTGGESIEAAVRMAKLHTGGFEVASLTRSWHGLTGGAAALTLSGGRRGYGPQMPGAFALPAPYAYRCPIRHCDGDLRLHLPGGRLRALRPGVGGRARRRVVAEPVLSAGGVIVPPPGYFARLLELCEEREMLLVLDECQTGLGRLGTMYGFEAFGVVPDFLVLSKTLGGGDPDRRHGHERRRSRRSATPAASCTSPRTCPTRCPRRRRWPCWRSCARRTCRRGRRAPGERLLGHLRELQARHEVVGDVRGMGLLCGLELVEDRDTRRPAEALGLALTAECEARGLSINLVRGGTGGGGELPADGAAADDLRRRDRPRGGDPRRLTGGACPATPHTTAVFLMTFRSGGRSVLMKTGGLRMDDSNGRSPGRR